MIVPSQRHLIGLKKKNGLEQLKNIWLLIIREKVDLTLELSLNDYAMAGLIVLPIMIYRPAADCFGKGGKL